jgi:BirA family transcriptional regulator, biotin operon repressor / biotin---[acetyl-CoA-carboxylase] ligase
VLIPTPVRHYTTIDSTNLEARRLFDKGERGKYLIVADEQTAGRGRLERPWVSARGNLYSTLVLPVEVPAQNVPQISFVAALAVFAVVQEFSKTPPKLKWPNDVLVRGAKIAGILCETISTLPNTLAIGCGINVSHSPIGLAYPATSLTAEGAATDRDKVLNVYDNAMASCLNMWNNGQNFAFFRNLWMKHAIGIGETITMTTGTQHLTGTFEAITEQGAVMLKPPHGPPHILHAGDMHIPSLAKLRNGNP